MSTKREDLDLLYSQLRDERASFIPHWRELNDYIRPRRGRFFTSDRNKGDRRTQRIIDSTATFAARTLQAGMMSGMTSPARPWFRLTTPDPQLAEQEDVKVWLWQVTQTLLTVFQKSNLYNVLPTLYSDMAIFGTGAIGEFEDDRDIVRFESYPVGSFMAANDERGVVRTFMRDFEMSVHQIVRRVVLQRDGTYDWSRVSARVKKLWDDKQYQEWITVVQAITINDNPKSGYTLSKFKKYSLCTWEAGGRGAQSGDPEFLEESGFDEYPVFVGRWEVTGEDHYGTSCPGMDALGDIKQLQAGEKRSLQAVDKMVHPPLVAPPGARSNKLTLMPGEVNFVQEGQHSTLRALHEVRFDVDKLELKNSQARIRIQRAFYEDLFLMMSQMDAGGGVQPRTAREIQERHEEKLLVLGPVLTQSNKDVFDPLIDRTFAITMRRGMIPEPPPSLEGQELRVEYISLMAQAQKSIGLGGLERFGQDIVQLASVDPTILDVVDTDNFARELAESTAVPPHVLKSPEAVEAIRQRRAQAEQAKATAENLKTVGAGVKHLSAADTSKESALSDLLSAAGRTGAPVPQTPIP